MGWVIAIMTVIYVVSIIDSILHSKAKPFYRNKYGYPLGGFIAFFKSRKRGA
jgi:uncharacterized membrane protein